MFVAPQSIWFRILDRKKHFNTKTKKIQNKKNWFSIMLIFYPFIFSYNSETSSKQEIIFFISLFLLHFTGASRQALAGRYQHHDRQDAGAQHHGENRLLLWRGKVVFGPPILNPQNRQLLVLIGKWYLNNSKTQNKPNYFREFIALVKEYLILQYMWTSNNKAVEQWVAKFWTVT